MSVIQESRKGDQIVCIRSFTAVGPSYRQCFAIGDVVEYIGSSFKETPEDNPIGPLVQFTNAEGHVFTAVANYFVTWEHWQEISEYYGS
jgi:hypothetical protein